jgi:drug/metabolite transporter (DMT)-like permease
LFLYVIARWTASATSYQLLLMPLVGVPVAALLLDEPLRATFVIGVVLSLVGVYLGAFAPPLGRLVPAIGRARPVPAEAAATTGGGTSSGPPDCVAGCP